MSGIPTSFVSARPNSWKNLVLDAGIVVVDLNVHYTGGLEVTGDYLSAVSTPWSDPVLGPRVPRYLGARTGSDQEVEAAER